jgi:hypothetical protein
MNTLNLREPEPPRPVFLPETLGVILRRWVKSSLEQYREWVMVYLGSVVVLALLMCGWLWNRHWNHSQCLEALKSRSEGVIVMALCGK